MTDYPELVQTQVDLLRQMIEQINGCGCTQVDFLGNPEQAQDCPQHGERAAIYYTGKFTNYMESLIRDLESKPYWEESPF